MAENPEGTNLLDAIAKALPRASTQALDISFNELLDMYKNKELNIAPDFQRLFQWSPGQRSRFIESLLLEMPVPPIFMIEEDEGRYVSTAFGVMSFIQTEIYNALKNGAYRRAAA
jgi:hypothetical protein